MLLHVLVALTLAITLCFCFVVLFGAPFLPTLQPQIRVALDMLNLKSGDTLLELGCGDGRVLVAAARRGINAVGYELNPLLALIAWWATRRYRSRVRVICGNYWTATWPKAEVVFAFI